MQHDSTVNIFRASGTRSGGACIRFDHAAGFSISAWCEKTEIRIPITHEHASALSDFLAYRDHEGAAHVFTRNADLFNGDHP